MRTPFLPNPQPDEILGSWFARIRLHNGDGWWQSLLQQVGLQILQKSMMRVPDYDPRLDRLLELLGMSFRTALLNHTRLPYVMAFQDVQHQGLGDEPGSSHPSTGARARTPRVDTEDPPRFCPECVGQDFDEAEPYWHLSHQLPNVAFCSVHQTLLLSACPACTQPVAQSAYRLIGPVPLHCSCGHSLSQRLKKSPEEPGLHRMIRLLSLEAARQPRGLWSNAQVRAYLRDEMRKSGLTEYLHFMLRDEPGYVATCSDSSIRHTHQVLGLTITVRKRWADARAHDLCVLMAMLRRSFAQDGPAIAATQVRPTRKVEHGRDRATMVSRLERYMQQWLAGRGYDPVFSAAYWYFRLQEPEHLGAYEGLRIVPIPSVEEDRALFRKRLHTDQERSKEQFSYLLHGMQPLYMRMSVRDAAWLKQVREDFVEASAPSASALQQLQATIRSTVQMLTHEEREPCKLTATTIALHAQQPVNKVRAAIERSDDLPGIIEAWNATYPERACQRAIEALHGAGQHLHPYGVVRAAGIKVSHTKTAERLLRTYVQLHRLRPEQYLFRRDRPSAELLEGPQDTVPGAGQTSAATGSGRPLDREVAR